MFTRNLTRIFGRLSGFFALVVVLVTPAAAHAFEMEYYTYGGFSDVVSAFTKCSLIFSDAGYMTLATTVFVASLAWDLASSAINKLYQAVPGEGGMPPSYNGIWGSILNALMATAVFFTLVVPKGSLHIYDSTEEGQYREVGGIPLVGVVAAGVSSLIEREIVSLVETAGSPLSFSKQAGVKGIQVMNGILARGAETPNGMGNLQSSLDRYINDCVLFEMGRPGTTLTVEEMKKGTASVVTSFAKAVNPAAFTVIFDPMSGSTSVGKSCTDAWTVINAALTDIPTAARFEGLKKRACKDGGYNVYDAEPTVANNAYTSCTTNTDSLIATISAGWTMDKLILESMLIRRFLAKVAQDAPYLNVQASKMVGLGSQLSEFLQGVATKRGVLVALAAVALPFVCLLLFTKNYKALLVTCFGLFMFPSIWGILMAAVTDFFLTNQIEVWSTLIGATWGVDAYAVFGDELALSSAYWGIYLAATFGLAMTLATKISSAAGSIGAMPAAQGAAAEGNLTLGKAGTGAALRQEVATGEGVAQNADKMAQSWAMSQTMPNQGNLMDYKQQVGSGVTQALNDSLSLGPGAVAKSTYGNQMRQHVDGSSGAESLEQTGINAAIKTGAYNQSAQVAQTAMRMGSTGGDFNKEAAWQHANDKATRDLFGNAENYGSFLSAQKGKELGHIQGEMQAYGQAKEAVRAAGGNADAYSWEAHNALMSKVNASQSFAKSAEFEKQAANLGLNSTQLAKVLEAGSQTRAVSEAVQTAGGQARDAQQAMQYASELQNMGPNATEADYRAFAQKHALPGGANAWEQVRDHHQQLRSHSAGALASVIQQRMAVTPEQQKAMQKAEQAATKAGAADPKGTLQALQQNMSSGNLKAIQGDKAQAAAFQSLAGKAVTDVQKMQGPQKQQILDKAQQSLPLREAATPALATANQYDSLADKMRELGPSATNAQYKEFLDQNKNVLPAGTGISDLRAMHQTVMGADAQGTQLMGSDMTGAPIDLERAAANQNSVLGGMDGSTAHGRASVGAETSPQEWRAVGGTQAKQALGEADAASLVQQFTGMDAREARAYVGSHQGQMEIARFQEMEKFANQNGHSFMDLAGRSQSSFSLNVGGKEAKSWGLPGAGTYNVSVGSDGRAVMTTRQAGQQYQVGVFGQTGTERIHKDVNDTIISKWTDNRSGSEVRSGSFVTRQLGDGTVETGTVDRHGNLSQGTRSSLVENASVRVQTAPDGTIINMGVLRTAGDRSTPNVTSDFRGSRTQDFAQRTTEGSSLTNVTNLQGASMDVGDGTTGPSSGRQAAALLRTGLNEGVDITTKVMTVFGGPGVRNTGPQMQNPYTSPKTHTGSMGEQVTEKGGWRSPFATSGSGGSAATPRGPVGSSGPAAPPQISTSSAARAPQSAPTTSSPPATHVDFGTGRPVNQPVNPGNIAGPPSRVTSSPSANSSQVDFATGRPVASPARRPKGL